MPAFPSQVLIPLVLQPWETNPGALSFLSSRGKTNPNTIACRSLREGLLRVWSVNHASLHPVCHQAMVR